MTKQTTQFEEHAYSGWLALEDEADAQKAVEVAGRPRVWYSKRRQRFEIIAFTRDLERVFAHGPTEEAAYTAWKAEYDRLAAFKALPWWHPKRWFA